MKSVLLTGASGFIGHHCIPRLIQDGFEVHAISSRKDPTGDRRVTWHSADLMNPEQVHHAVKAISPSHLLHLAWYTAPGKFWSAPENIQWLQASLGLLREFCEAGGSRMVGAGTCAEYDWRYGFCSENVTPLNPQSLYGITKQSFDNIAGGFLSQTETSYAWGRIFFLYGPNEHRSRLVPSIINSLLASRPAPCSAGYQIRDYLFVEDVADAFVRMLNSAVGGPVNIGSGKPVSVREIIDLIGKKIGREDLIQYGQIPTVSSDPPFIVADNRRLINEVGWQQHYSLDAGLDKTIAWWRQNM